MIALGCALLVAASSTAAAQASITEQLKTNIARTDRAIVITEAEVARTRVQPYAPEIQFRLAELYVEKSRYLYLLHQVQVAVGSGSQVAPEVRLVKQKAIDIYERLLRDAPDWSGDDRVQFYLAHELRELGQFDRMLKLETELADKHPKSPLAAEAMLIVGDHWFAAKDLAKAEVAYQRVLAGPASPTQDLARFKLGWVRLNQGKHEEAVTYFEAAASSAAADGASADVLSVKREALFDLVFSYTEVRPWQGSVEYFEKLAGNHALFVGVLEKLANRYFVKQEAEAAVPAYRRLLELSRNPERDQEFAGRLYESLKAAGDKSPAKAVDVQNIIRVAARARTDDHLDAATRKADLEELEVYARDLATGMLIAARRTAGIDASGVSAAVKNKEDFSEAADAHEAWLSLFRNSPQKLAMERNQADALFLAERWYDAGRAFETVADEPTAGAEREDALYNALAAYARVVPLDRTSGAPVLDGAWHLSDARRAMAQLGAQYVSAYPKSTRVAQVKFNVARAAYDSGDWKRSAELFAALVREHPTSTDVAAAANLALDALQVAGDYESLEKVGTEIGDNPQVASSVRQDIRDIVARSRSERLSAVALQSSAASGDAAKGLVELAAAKSGTELGDQALYAAFTTYREKKDLGKVTEVAAQYLQTYPKSPKVVDVLATIARAGMELADYDLAASEYRTLYERFPRESSSLDAARTSATLDAMLGDARGDLQLLERIPEEQRDDGLWRQISEAKLMVGDAAGAEAAARAALDLNDGDADAGVLLGQAMLAQHKDVDASKELQRILASARKSTVSESSMAKLWDVAGEAALRAMLALPPDPLEPKVNALKLIQEATTSVAQLSAGDMAVEGIYRLAVGFDHLARTLTELPAPAKLSAGDKEKFLAAITQQANGVRAQAAQAFDTCATKAQELEVFAPFVAGCLSKTPLPEQTEPTVSFSNASSAAPVQTARAALKWGATNAGQIEALGVAQLAAGDFRRARLSFQRSVEVDATRASAQAALGVAFARLGEWASARAAYHRALELDGTSDRAHAGLAALYCRFGRKEQGRKELAQMKSHADPAAADADPEVAQCGAP